MFTHVGQRLLDDAQHLLFDGRRKRCARQVVRVAERRPEALAGGKLAEIAFERLAQVARRDRDTTHQNQNGQRGQQMVQVRAKFQIVVLQHALGPP